MTAKSSGLVLYPRQREVAFSDSWRDAKFILLMGGARATKTALIVTTILLNAIKFPYSRQLICRQFLKDVKTSIMRDTIPKMSRIIGYDFYKLVKGSLNKADLVYSFPNGSEIQLGGLGNEEQVDSILGTEYCTIFFNEASQMYYSVVETVLTRLALNVDNFRNKAYFDYNPPSQRHWGYELFHRKINPHDKKPLSHPELYCYHKMLPDDNVGLSEDYKQNVLGVMSLRQQKRYLKGEYGTEVEGALWSMDMIDHNRVQQAPPRFAQTLVSVDPAITSESKSDETGIMVGGRYLEKGYLLADLSGRYRPLQWAKTAIDAYYEHKAQAIIIEDNAGKDLIIQNLKIIDPRVPIIRVHAKTSKALRAEPIVTCYQQGRIKHVGIFVDLEDQMISHRFILEAGQSMVGQRSPDRIDALVYLFWALLIERRGGYTRVY